MINIDIELYKVFYVVSITGNITKAAQNLYISQPAVTMSIKKLEEQLETTLFIRTKRGVILTEEGKVLFEYVKQAMISIKMGENKIENLKKLDTGNIRIGIGTTLTKYFLLEYLKEFHKKYPKVTINIDTSMTKDILNNLENGKIDIAVVISDESSFKRFNIEYEKEIEDIFIASDKFKFLKNKTIALDELKEYPLLFQSPDANTRKYLDYFCFKNNIKLETTMDLASYSLILEFTKIGMGIGFIVKDYVKSNIESGEIFEVKVKPKIPKRKIYILTKKNYLPSFSVLKLINIVKGDIN